MTQLKQKKADFSDFCKVNSSFTMTQLKQKSPETLGSYLGTLKNSNTQNYKKFGTSQNEKFKFRNKRERCLLCNSSDGASKFVTPDGRQGYKCFACDKVTFINDKPSYFNLNVQERDYTLSQTERNNIVYDCYKESEANFGKDNFSNFFMNKFQLGNEYAESFLKSWHVFSDGKNNTTFWYCNKDGKPLFSKVCLYNENGNRIKKGIDTKLFKADFLYGFQKTDTTIYFSQKFGYDNQILFGLQKLTNKIVVLVESEKNAIYGNWQFGHKFDFLATGGVSGLKEIKAEPLKNKTVFILFDCDPPGVERSLKANKLLTDMNIRNTIITPKEFVGNVKNGYDLADQIIEKYKSEEALCQI